MGQAIQVQSRKYGLDLFRCLGMLLVIVLHICNHGGLVETCASNSMVGAVSTSIMIFAYPAVDCFVLLSGYLLTKAPFRLSRAIRIWCHATFWSVVIQTAFYLLKPGSISLGKTIFMFFPILSERYWFVNAYVVMLLFSPFLNCLLLHLPKWQMRCLLLTAVAVFCLAPVPTFGNDVFKVQNGFSFPWFVVLYLSGGYIRKYVNTTQTMRCGRYLILGVCLHAFHLAWVLGIERVGADILGLMSLKNLFMKYTSVPVFGASVCLLIYFASEKFNRENLATKVCGHISPVAFSVYLIHDHPLVREYFINGRFAVLSQFPWPVMILGVVGSACMIFTVCIVLSLLENWLFGKLKLQERIDKLSEWLTVRFVTQLKGEL